MTTMTMTVQMAPPSSMKSSSHHQHQHQYDHHQQTEALESKPRRRPQRRPSLRPQQSQPQLNQPQQEHHDESDKMYAKPESHSSRESHQPEEEKESDPYLNAQHQYYQDQNQLQHQKQEKYRPKRNRRQRPRRRIDFEEFDEVFEIPHICDMSQSEINSVWTGRNGLRNIRNKCIDIIDRIQGGERGLCVRGLEHYFDPESQSSKEVKRMRGELLAYVQQVEDLKGVAMPDMFASLYAKMSQESRDRAYVRGLEDERICKAASGRRKKSKPKTSRAA